MSAMVLGSDTPPLGSVVIRPRRSRAALLVHENDPWSAGRSFVEPVRYADYGVGWDPMNMQWKEFERIATAEFRKYLRKAYKKKCERLASGDVQREFWYEGSSWNPAEEPWESFQEGVLRDCRTFLSEYRGQVEDLQLGRHVDADGLRPRKAPRTYQGGDTDRGTPLLARPAPCGEEEWVFDRVRPGFSENFGPNQATEAAGHRQEVHR